MIHSGKVLFDETLPYAEAVKKAQNDIDFETRNPNFLLADVEFFSNEEGKDIGLKYYYTIIENGKLLRH